MKSDCGEYVVLVSSERRYSSSHLYQLFLSHVTYAFRGLVPPTPNSSASVGPTPAGSFSFNAGKVRLYRRAKAARPSSDGFHNSFPELSHRALRACRPGRTLTAHEVINTSRCLLLTLWEQCATPSVNDIASKVTYPYPPVVFFFRDIPSCLM